MLLIKQEIKIYKILNLLYTDSVGFSLSGYVRTNDLINFCKSAIFMWHTATSTVENKLELSKFFRLNFGRNRV